MIRALPWLADAASSERCGRGSRSSGCAALRDGATVVVSSPDIDILEGPELSRRLSTGSAAVIPTDTLPGLAMHPEWADRLWTIKQRPADKPLILMGSSAVELISLCEASCRDEAMTMALDIGRCSHPCSAFHGSGGGKAQSRWKQSRTAVPNSSLTRSFLSRTGPLATTSANRSGEPSCTSAAEAAVVFPDLPQLGPQPWPGLSGQASTVLAWVGPGRWRLLRRGAVIPTGCQDR